MSTEHSEYSTLRVESENASRDYDALVAKRALAGLTLSAASKSILEGNDWLLGRAVGYRSPSGVVFTGADAA